MTSCMLVWSSFPICVAHTSFFSPKICCSLRSRYVLQLRHIRIWLESLQLYFPQSLGTLDPGCISPSERIPTKRIGMYLGRMLVSRHVTLSNVPHAFFFLHTFSYSDWCGEVFEKESNQGANLMDAWHQMASSIHSKPSTSLPINYPFIVYVNKRRRSSIRNRKKCARRKRGRWWLDKFFCQITTFIKIGVAFFLGLKPFNQ